MATEALSRSGYIAVMSIAGDGGNGLGIYALYDSSPTKEPSTYLPILSFLFTSPPN
jgi:hypothetical protein